MALTKITGQVINDTTGLVVGVTTVGGGVSAVDGFFSGIVTFSNDVSIAGTLTYEDVTNVSSVGNITVGSGITLSKDGDIFFTGIMTGNGSGLTGVANTDVIFTDKLSVGDSPELIAVGVGSDLRLFHDGNSYLRHDGTGDLYIQTNGSAEDIFIQSKDNLEIRVNNQTDLSVQCTGNAGTALFHQGNQKLTTASGGVTVTGTVAATSYTGDGSGLTGVGVTVAEGGDASYSYTSGGKNYMVHVFRSTTSGVFRTNKDMSIDFLLVGGGGGSATAEGSYGQSGAGGGGGIVEGSGFSLSAGSYVVTVGAGGVASNSTTVGGNGGDTTFAGVTAKGGGGGGDYASAGADGGCGGGGANPNAAGGATIQSSQNSGISNITQYGFAGGQGGNYNSDPRGGGGGGGAGGAGGTASAAGNGVGGARGAGRANSLSGTSVTYAIGGRGGKSGRQDAYPGEDGFGHGADGASAAPGDEGIGARGGSGIVLIRYEV